MQPRNAEPIKNDAAYMWRVQELGRIELTSSPGVIVTVRAADADDARRILTEDG